MSVWTEHPDSWTLKLVPETAVAWDMGSLFAAACSATTTPLKKFESFEYVGHVIRATVTDGFYDFTIPEDAIWDCREYLGKRVADIRLERVHSEAYRTASQTLRHAATENNTARAKSALNMLASVGFYASFRDTQGPPIIGKYAMAPEIREYYIASGKMPFVAALVCATTNEMAELVCDAGKLTGHDIRLAIFVGLGTYSPNAQSTDGMTTVGECFVREYTYAFWPRVYLHVLDTIVTRYTLTAKDTAWTFDTHILPKGLDSAIGSLSMP